MRSVISQATPHAGAFRNARTCNRRNSRQSNRHRRSSARHNIGVNEHSRPHSSVIAPAWPSVVRSCDQLRVGDAPPNGRAEQALKALHGVVAHVAITKPESELSDIAMQMLGAGVVIDAVQSALEQREHALNTVRRHIAAHILASAVIDTLVLVEQPTNAVVDRAFVCVDGRAGLDMATSETVGIASGDGIADFGLYPPALSFAASDNGSLANTAAPQLEALTFVLRGLFATNVAFVDFDRSGQFGRVITASLAEPLQHEPSGLLSDADLRVKLDAADTLTGRDEQIHGIEPLVQRHLGPLENRACANGEIEQAGIASVEAALARPDALRLAASWAGGPVRPAPRLEIRASALLIGEHLEQFKCADRGFAHAMSNLRVPSACV